jgi:hypothetical protein
VPDPYVIIEVNWPLDKKGRVAATGKGRPKFSTRGGFVKATRDFESKIKEAAIEAMADRKLSVLNEALGLRVIAYMPIPESWSVKTKAAAIRRRYHADHPAGFREHRQAILPPGEGTWQPPGIKRVA